MKIPSSVLIKMHVHEVWLQEIHTHHMLGGDTDHRTAAMPGTSYKKQSLLFKQPGQEARSKVSCLFFLMNNTIT